ncbi:Piriformospora indica-insensitive protein 2 [Capsicum annuum]|uniref:Piriformospora indica-insensitive protein 2 n=1 Tax=Capsicum annuum TaxID=4072 RepID=A0A1U8EMI2_CAPAN|nr:piriformospora indica-insensitive protein 2 [Capsicum annuum]KAF3634670.1 Piriformospora indica-insensitive protein 2 [Capsicum annuum]KAF3672021.1 Piriformospora indica-insensitive protein 2 [Capsicum annuum]PHT67488.1 Piriformospora indica-insensitive protein 2 [Capsicum annuum]
MRGFKNSRFCVLVIIFLLHFGVWCNGDTENMGAPMEQNEINALYSTIQGFVGKSWNGSDLYPDPCGWTPIQGVSCDLFDGFWYVTDINIGPIHDNSLSCTPNAEFNLNLFTLKHLKSLLFFNCFVSPRHHPTSIPSEGWELLASTLESLEFRSNPGLIGQIPSTFGRLRKLQSLVLIENGLSGEMPPNLGSLVNLRRLVLAGNKLNGEIPETFGGFTQLLICDLSRNSLSGVLPKALFGGLVSLLKLDLSSNNLQGKIPQEISKLKNLTLLDLSNNKLSNGLTKSLQEMTCLEELVLSKNPMGGFLEILDWHNMRKLTTLDLSNMNLTGGIPKSIADLKKLRFLGLNDNKLMGDIPKNLENLPYASAIYLYGNNLTGELQFSEWFYSKMGRRFGAWGNENLCYPIGLVSTSNVPYGVKQCQQELNIVMDLDTKSKLVNGSLLNSQSSMGYLNDYGIWRSYVVELFMVILLLLN